MTVNFGEPKPSLEEALAHYGVKGMKWGVTKSNEPSKPGGRSYTTFTKEQRKAANKDYNHFASKAIEGKFAGENTTLFTKPISEAEYQKLSNKDEIIKKGSTLYRTQSKADGTGKTDVTYASTNRADADVYAVALSRQGIRGIGGRSYKESYEVTMKNVETLRSPSEKARVDAFINMMDSPSIVLKNGKTVTGRQWLRNSDTFKKDAKKLDAQQLGLKSYNSFTETQWMSSPINTAYFKAIRDQGYNAVVDDNDRGHLTKQPVILLNADGSVKQMNVRRLTADDINSLKSTIKVPSER